MSSVFLADVDDYLSPSMACVNPAFAGAGATGTGTGTAGGSGTVLRVGSPSIATNPTTTATDSTTTTITTAEAADGSNGSSPRFESARSGVVVAAAVGRHPRRPWPRRGGGGRNAGLDRGAVGRSSTGKSRIDDNHNTKKVTASIVDCLACSGCVTTAETVLLKEHSLDKFRQLMDQVRNDNKRRTIGTTTTTGSNNDSMEMDQGREGESDINDDQGSTTRVVATLSIASAAELLRLLVHRHSQHDISNRNCEAEEVLELCHRKLVALLCRQLHVDAVLDGRLALEWSLQQSALEFCDTYQQGQQQVQQHRQEPTLASSTTEPDPAAIRINTVVSSSCPATVCYVEKTCPVAVPHLSRVASPMGCARAYLSRRSRNKKRHPGIPGIRHVAIMPCHDKKLEATRPLDMDTASDGDTKDVLVLTTADAYQLLLESMMRHDDAMDDNFPAEEAKTGANHTEGRLRALFEAIPPAPVDGVTSTREFEPRQTDPVPHSWITSTTGALPGAGRTPNGYQILHTSGGYADYIFRFASRRLFGANLARVEWRPVPASAVAVSGGSTSSKTPEAGGPRPASARVALARREILEATLYRHVYVRHGSGDDVVAYACHEHPATTSNGDGFGPVALVASTPVLRFAMAHGLQVMQRAIATAGSSEGRKYHYVEAMACPSGCLNGGGQVLPSASAVASASEPDRAGGRRESPSEVKARVAAARHNLLIPFRPALAHDPSPDDDAMEVDSVRGVEARPSHHHERRCEQLVTTFHAVQPLQLQYGAAKGMAVKDIQW